MMAYFKCRAPRSTRLLSNGAGLKFQPVNVEEGIYATDNEGLIKELRTMIREQRGAIWEIQEQEYDTLKKNRITSQPWREEIGRRGYEVNRAPVPRFTNPVSPEGEVLATAPAPNEGSFQNPPVAGGEPNAPMPSAYKPRASKRA